jgi:hypothetical protein
MDLQPTELLATTLVEGPHDVPLRDRGRTVLFRELAREPEGVPKFQVARLCDEGSRPSIDEGHHLVARARAPDGLVPQQLRNDSIRGVNPHQRNHGSVQPKLVWGHAALIWNPSGILKRLHQSSGQISTSVRRKDDSRPCPGPAHQADVR